ncbi:hypothetical protein ILUMI_16910 [Ignelater luminosus]|uniref:Retroviral polymerase SH3-like domain-containing protein n=1 Tax=Ignelater luminosus TaxID=2038154 RepID=A0A8K0CRE9_IGNLU|nr:hypothetical protein ILUMI_16910 [Ignelater luminosus]
MRYAASQNGVAEHLNYITFCKVRCMILNANISKTLWSEAVMAAVYIINRSPSVALNKKTPAEMWFDVKPNLQKLKVFGCSAYLRIPKEILKSKLDSRSKKCHMMGFCPNGYRLWDPENNKIIKGFDVKFCENEFFESYKSDEPNLKKKC